MSNRRIFLAFFEALLVFGLFRGAFLLKDGDIPRIAIFTGIAVNLFLQFVIVSAIRKSGRTTKPSPEEQALLLERQRAILKNLLAVVSCFVVVLMVNVALFISHVYSARAFAIVSLIAMVFAFTFLTFRFGRLQKSRG